MKRRRPHHDARYIHWRSLSRRHCQSKQLPNREERQLILVEVWISRVCREGGWGGGGDFQLMQTQRPKQRSWNWSQNWHKIVPTHVEINKNLRSCFGTRKQLVAIAAPRLHQPDPKHCMQLDLATKGDVWTKYSIGRPQNNFSLLPVTTVWIGKVVPCLLIEKKKKFLATMKKINA